MYILKIKTSLKVLNLIPVKVVILDTGLIVKHFHNGKIVVELSK